MDVRPKIERDGEPEEDPRQGFPKYLVRDLVAQNLDSEERRLRAQLWIFALGMALLALAMPTEHLLGDGMRRIDRLARDQASWSDPWAAVLRLLAQLPGFSLEQAGFLAAALGWGACFLGLARLGGRLGLERGWALSMGLLVCGAPALVLAGTLPGQESWVGALAIALFTCLLGPVDRPGKPRIGIAILLGLGLLGLDWRSLVLLPACTLAVDRARGRVLAPFRGPAADERERAPIEVRRAPKAAMTFGLLGLEIVVIAGMMLTITRAPDPVTRELGAASIPLGNALLSALAGGALLVLGVLALTLAPGDEGESRPPLWIGVWAGGGVLLLLDPRDQLLAWALLAPAALAGIAHGFARLEARTVWKLALPLLAMQLAFATWAIHRVRGTDPLAEWSALATRRLEPKDLVVTDSPARRYLLTHRWGVRALLGPRGEDIENEGPLVGEIRAALDLRHRVVIDGSGSDKLENWVGSRLQRLAELPDPAP